MSLNKPYGDFPPTNPAIQSLVSFSFTQDPDRWVESYITRSAERIRKNAAFERSRLEALRRMGHKGIPIR